MYVGGCFDKYISAAIWPPQIKIPGSAPSISSLLILSTYFTHFTVYIFFFLKNIIYYF